MSADFRSVKPGVEIVEGYLPLGATPSARRLLRQTVGKMVADKIAELDAFEMVPGPVGEPWVLRCRLIIHFSGAVNKLPKED